MLFFCFFSNSSCCSNRPSSNSDSCSFPNSVVNVIFDKISFSEMNLFFSCHPLVRDLITFKFKLLLVKTSPRAIKCYIKWGNILCKSRIFSHGNIPNISYSWETVFNLDLLTSYIPPWVVYKVYIILLAYF